VEGIRDKATGQCAISFDEFLFDKDAEKQCFKFKTRLSLPWLLEACRSLSQHTIDTELQFLKDKTGNTVNGLYKSYNRLGEQIKELSENETIIQMGWGAGWRGMTGQLLESGDLTADLRKRLRLEVRYLSFPFPKSRRVAASNGMEQPMGWVKLSFTPMQEIKNVKQNKTSFATEGTRPIDKFIAAVEILKPNDAGPIGSTIDVALKTLETEAEKRQFALAVMEHMGKGFKKSKANVKLAAFLG
jgi:hypothetical protein